MFASLLLFGLIPFDKAAVKATIYSLHLGFLWEFLRHWWEVLRSGPLSWAILGGLALCLALEFFFGRRRHKLVAKTFFFDYGLLVLNTVLLGSVIGFLYHWINQLYLMWLPLASLRVLADKPLFVQVMAGFLVNDFAIFFSHWVRHKLPPLWHIHAIHHSETTINPATLFRQHPLDPVAGGVITYVPLALLGGSVWAGTLLVLFDTVWAMYAHSDLPMSWGPLKYVLVTPAYHRIHHSIEPRHWDKNFGHMLTLWDWLFRSAYFDVEDSFELGLQDFPVKPESRDTAWSIFSGWCRLNWYPFQAMGQLIARGRLWQRLGDPRGN
jgi:sterol desaturase/sphingolipid hydroxylase (fatty acid hydroxylase superfamily)